MDKPITPFNPSVVHELKMSKDCEEWLKTVSPDSFSNFDQIQKYWNQPSTQFVLTLMKDAEFKAAAEQMEQSHLGNQFIGYELLLILILWAVRAWRLTKVNTLLTRMWTQMWVGIIYWGIALFLVPSLVWGEAYRTALSHFTRAAFRHFFA